MQVLAGELPSKRRVAGHALVPGGDNHGIERLACSVGDRDLPDRARLLFNRRHFGAEADVSAQIKSLGVVHQVLSHLHMVRVNRRRLRERKILVGRDLVFRVHVK